MLTDRGTDTGGRRGPMSRGPHRLIGLIALAILVASCGSSTVVPSPAHESRYASGIPTTLDGQVVYLGYGAAVHARATTDSTPFLVGGWFGDGMVVGCAGGIGGDPSPLLHTCVPNAGGDAPFESGAVQPVDGGPIFWNGHWLPANQGPAIVRVHTHDALAAACWPESRARCESVLVVDAVLWTGDTWTRAAPIGVTEAFRRLGSIGIDDAIQTGPKSYGLLRQQFVFATPHPVACPAPWPHQVYDLHGDPRFGLVAVFPDVEARQDAEAAYGAESTCLPDARIERPGLAQWVGVGNVLVLTYDSQVADAVKAVLTSTTTFTQASVPFPPASVDESYLQVLDFEAAREASYTDTSTMSLSSISGVTDIEKNADQRYLANALSFTVEPGVLATASNVSPRTWTELQKVAVPGTARLFVVDHPSSTDPALRQERLIAYQEHFATIDSWQLMLLPAAS